MSNALGRSPGLVLVALAACGGHVGSGSTSSASSSGATSTATSMASTTTTSMAGTTTTSMAGTTTTCLASAASCPQCLPADHTACAVACSQASLYCYYPCFGMAGGNRFASCIDGTWSLGADSHSCAPLSSSTSTVACP